MGRTLEYGMELADAHPDLGGRRLSLYVHPREDTILIQAEIAQQSESQLWDYGVWRGAAYWLVHPVGCTVGDPYPVAAGTLEVRFQCPPGVNIRELVARNRSTLQQGIPLRP